ncbi:hypothetical protein SNEBB_008939 [Seison nebaliae]|nr:hypothetical protein SNEBB_008939 [Seison nebaliae]
MIYLLIIAVLCQSTNLGYGKNSNKPKLKVDRQNYQFSYGRAGNVKVRLIQGTGLIEYHWKFNNQRLPSGVTGEGLILSINNFRKRMEGIYTLTATNNYGSYQVSLTLMVENHHKPALFLQNRIYHIAFGKPFELEVMETEGSKPITYEWKLNNKDVPKGVHVHNGILTIDQFKKRMVGTYTLEASNVYGAHKITIFFYAE